MSASNLHQLLGRMLIRFASIGILMVFVAGCGDPPPPPPIDAAALEQIEQEDAAIEDQESQV